MSRFALPATLAALYLSSLTAAVAQDKPNPAKPVLTPAPQTAPARPGGALLMPAAPVAPPRPSDPNIVGSVGGKNILFMQVAERLRRDNPDGFKQAMAQALGAKVANSLYGDIPQASVTITSVEAMTALRDIPNLALYRTLQQMLQEEAVAQTATKENVVATDAQVDEYLKNLLSKAREAGQVPAAQTDDQFLAERKLSRPVLMERLRSQLELEKLMEKDAGLQKALAQQAVQSFGHTLSDNDYLQARHILVVFPGAQPGAPGAQPPDKNADAVALAKANKIAADIKSGKKTFEAAAKESSDDPGSKLKGGELGVFSRGTMVPEFTKAAFAAKPGDITGPVKSQFGYHLIQVEKLGKDLTPEQRATARTALYQRYEQQNPQLLQGFMKNLMENRAKVATYMTPPPAPAQPGFPGAQGG